MKEFNLREVFDEYPNISNPNGQLDFIAGDVMLFGKNGRIELITQATIIECKSKNKTWYELKINKSILVDAGIKDFEVKL